MSEIPLAGGDVNIGEHAVVRVGDTVRRPLSDRAGAVHALLRHFEAGGFDGAPRVLGIDERGREMLSWVDGEPALAPVADTYGLAPEERVRLLEVVDHRNELAYELHRGRGGIERRPGWREMWDGGSGDTILSRRAWFEGQRDDLLAFLR